MKKCFFETYRFSEDLDFTVPAEIELSLESIQEDLIEAGTWVKEQTGISLPRGKMKVEKYLNKRGRDAYQAKVAYGCRLNLAPNSLQKIKFDITQDEWLASPSDHQAVSHPYEDARDPAPRIRCYSIEEILAEKTRALCERSGRARDVYDLVHLSREFRESIDPVKAAEFARSKFAFKGLPGPSVELILSSIDHEVLRANWEGQLRHQLRALPPVEGFLEDLRDAIAWWLEPGSANPELAPVSGEGDRVHVPLLSIGPSGVRGGSRSTTSPAQCIGLAHLDRIRFAARNRLYAEIVYDGATRRIEPYSLRRTNPGKTRLFGYEQSKNGVRTSTIKSYFVDKIKDSRVTEVPFRARYRVEL